MKGKMTLVIAAAITLIPLLAAAQSVADLDCA